MKKSLVLLLAGLCCAGCIVQSIRPWLSEESRVAEPALLGAWHDAKQEIVAFFADSSSADYDYDVTLAGADESSRFQANLHRVDDILLLVVGPEERQDAGVYATVPGQLLFKAVWDGDSLKFHAIDLDTFPDRTANTQTPFLPGGSKNDGYVLTGTAADSEAFLRAQLADPAFFDPDPLYSFRKLPAAAE